MQDNERLAKEVQELNDTVFSRSFKAPSAWAEREVKYKAEKRDWTAQQQRLQNTIDRLREENLGYRASNKAAEFEDRIQVSATNGRAVNKPCKQCLGSLNMQVVTQPGRAGCWIHALHFAA